MFLDVLYDEIVFELLCVVWLYWVYHMESLSV